MLRIIAVKLACSIFRLLTSTLVYGETGVGYMDTLGVEVYSSP